MLSKLSQLRSPLSNSSLSSNQPTSSGSSSGGQNSPNSIGSNSSYNNSDRNNPLSSSSSFASFLNFNHHHRSHFHNPLVQSDNIVSSSQLNQIYDHRPSFDYQQQVVKSATVRSNNNCSGGNNSKHNNNNTMATGAVVTGSTNSQQSMFKVSCNSLIQLSQLHGTGGMTTAPRPFARKKHLQQKLLNQSDSLKQRTMNGSSSNCNNEFRMTEIANLNPSKLNGSTSCINLQNLNLLNNNHGTTTNFVNKSCFNRSVHSLNQSKKQPTVQTLQSAGKSMGSVTGVKSTSSSPAPRRSPNTPDLGYNTLLSSFNSNEMPSTSAIKPATKGMFDKVNNSLNVFKIVNVRS